MPLTFHPDTGTIVICDYSTGFQPPEMVEGPARRGCLAQTTWQPTCDGGSDQQHGAIPDRTVALRTPSRRLSSGKRQSMGQGRYDRDSGNHQVGPDQNERAGWPAKLPGVLSRAGRNVGY